MTGEALVSLNLIAHINSTQVTTFSSLFAHALQSALVSHAQHSLYNRGGHGSGVLELTPAGYLIFLDTELESKFVKKQIRIRNHFLFFTVADVREVFIVLLVKHKYC